MAQQTGVDRVVPKWHELLDRWPDAAALAGADLGDILAVWTGLGYPRRARDLQATARQVVERHGGVVPDVLSDLLALSGVGPYTARAVLAFAFEQPVGVVDTNVARVLARSQGRRLASREAQATADALVPAGDGWLWNQTLMEVGAVFCRPTPRCDGCPVRGRCRWADDGWPEPDPAPGSAGVSRRQARFAGSDREARGRLMRALLAAPQSRRDALAATGVVGDEERAGRIVDGLIADRLVLADSDGAVRLP
ncbi:MAG: A/G-specific adenine glycosylase [Acidimicrobiia bacterium]|nr:A/G-specific adenine glycosylase [Acidimicrobiia bacterium]